MNSAELASLLDRGAVWGPEYRNGLSNHLPMALVALEGLGADPQRLHEFAAVYGQRLAAMAATPRLPAEQGDAWLTRRGDPAAYSELRVFFENWLRRDGKLAVLREALPALVSGSGGAAFHGLLRTSYAVDSGHAGELAAGLAYWACRHLPLAEGLRDEPTEGDVVAWAERLHCTILRPAAGRPLIFQLMADVAATPGFAAAAGDLRPTSMTLRDLAALAGRRYLGSRDFTVLHLVTSCHGLRLLMPYLAEPERALRHYALAFGAALIASGTAPDVAAPTVEPLAWSELTARACRSDNDHVIKLVYTCLRESQAYGDDSYRQIATLAVGA